MTFMKREVGIIIICLGKNIQERSYSLNVSFLKVKLWLVGYLSTDIEWENKETKKVCLNQ